MKIQVEMFTRSVLAHVMVARNYYKSLYVRAENDSPKMAYIFFSFRWIQAILFTFIFNLWLIASASGRYLV